MLRYWLAQIRQAWAKREKDPAFRLRPAIDIIVPSAGLKPGARILCIGARNRHEPDTWRAEGFDVIAIDILPSPSLIFMDMHSLRFNDGTFDLVYASHVFEHALYPRKALAEACRVLKRPGYLYAAFPTGFVPNDHDRVDFGSVDGFRRELPLSVRLNSAELYRRDAAGHSLVLLELK